MEVKGTDTPITLNFIDVDIHIKYEQNEPAGMVAYEKATAGARHNSTASDLSDILLREREDFASLQS